MDAIGSVELRYQRGEGETHRAVNCMRVRMYKKFITLIVPDPIRAPNHSNTSRKHLPSVPFLPPRHRPALLASIFDVLPPEPIQRHLPRLPPSPSKPLTRLHCVFFFVVLLFSLFTLRCHHFCKNTNIQKWSKKWKSLPKLL